MCPTHDLQLLVRWQPPSDMLHVVCSVPDAGGIWDQIFDESLPASNLTSGLSLLVTLWSLMVLEESGTSTSTETSTIPDTHPHHDQSRP